MVGCLQNIVWVLIIKIMKTIKNLVIATLLCAGCAVGYRMGLSQGEQYYEAACHMSDLIRCYEDHLKEDSIIEDYGCFEELESIFLYDDGIGKPVDLHDYSWCY